MCGERSHGFRNGLLVIAAVLISLTILFSTSFINDIPPDMQTTLIWETNGTPDSMDPHVDYESFGAWILYNVYETLYTYSWDSSATDPLKPLLALNQPLISADGLNYTITLRSGITFHDGTPFNASCVKWNFERLLKIFYEDGPVWLIAEPILGGESVEEVALNEGTSSTSFKSAFDDWVLNSNAIIVLDETHIRFVLERPYSPFLKVLAHPVTSIMSPSFQLTHASAPTLSSWGEYGVDYGEYENYMATHTCGTGPYTLTNWVPDQYVELTQFSDYWRTSTSIGAGSIEKVYIRTIEDQSSRSLDLRYGTSDVAYWLTTYALDIWNPDTEESLDPNIHVSTGGASYTMMFLGYNIGTLNHTDGTVVKSPYANKDFRQCSSYAFDYDAFMNAGVNGFGMKAKGPIPYGMFGYNATSYKVYYNLTTAVTYWNAAMTDPAFIQSMNNMTDELTIYYINGNVVGEQSSVILADGLTKMYNDSRANHTGLTKDITFTTQALEWSNYLEQIRNRQMPIFFIDWAPDYADPDECVGAFCYHLGIYAQRIGYNNSVVNTNYLLAKEETDPTTRMHYYNLINDQLAEDAPYLWVYQATEFRTWRAWLHGDGLIYNPMHSVYFYHLQKILPTE